MHPLVKRQIRKALGPDAVLSDQLRAFVAAVSDAYTAADDDRRRLEHSLELASTELYERNRDMATILDNVSGGFVVVELDGTLSGQCSRALTQWFGALDTRLPAWTYLFGDSELATWTELGFISLRNGTLPSDVVLGQLPSATERAGRQLSIEYRPIGEPLTAILVVVHDVTEEIAQRREARIQTEIIGIMKQAAADRAGVLEFLNNTDELVALCCDPATQIDELQRVIHTIKGNVGLFGIASVAEVCHELETRLADAGPAVEAEARTRLRDAWNALCDRVSRLFDGARGDVVVIERTEYRAGVALLGDGAAADRVRRWGQIATRTYLERFGEQARQLAERLDKPGLEVEIVDRGVTIEHERFAPLWSALANVIRNAIDHGIEPPDRRLAAGKPEAGHLALRTDVRDGALIVEIEDDGPGIDWRGLEDRARALGVTATGAEALFAAGVSTADEVTEISGRGVGMSAIRETCVALGGRLELSSTPGRGTAVRCIVPLTAPAARPAAAKTAAAR